MSDHELVFEKGLLLLGLAYIKTAGLCYRFIVSQSKWCGKGPPAQSGFIHELRPGYSGLYFSLKDLQGWKLDNLSRQPGLEPD